MVALIQGQILSRLVKIYTYVDPIPEGCYYGGLTGDLKEREYVRNQ